MTPRNEVLLLVLNHYPWVAWVAQDGDGSWWGYQSEPTFCEETQTWGLRGPFPPARKLRVTAKVEPATSAVENPWRSRIVKGVCARLEVCQEQRLRVNSALELAHVDGRIAAYHNCIAELLGVSVDDPTFVELLTGLGVKS